MSGIQASQRLMDLIFEAVDEGLTLLRSGRGLAPYMMLLTREGYVLQRFTGDTVSECLDKAYASLREQDEDTLAYALVYDAVVTVDEQDSDAVLVEAGERGQSDGLRFARRYRPPTAAAPFATIGELALLGKSEQYLR